MQRGFASIILLIAILFVAGLAGAYYLGKNSDKLLLGQQDKVVNSMSSSPSPTSDEIANWKTYRGETIYTSDGSSMFTIQYPSNWETEGNILYPRGKGKDLGLTPKIVLGAGGHGAPAPGGEKIFPAGKANYWHIEEVGGKLSLIASFPIGNISYIFESNNLQPADEEVFLKMLETFEIAN